ncbi:hypothetical protein EVAR_24869_1 [Eumeta japonica]|uniref:Uncharacterized protein n=1 Tax=Eumeta variegata TaxID=151549 RepID=A0A4C1Y7S2_EUMVA|nr:hypothetical protein EVAR_24869_1 [Eumeta japonica]
MKQTADIDGLSIKTINAIIDCIAFNVKLAKRRAGLRSIGADRRRRTAPISSLHYTCNARQSHGPVRVVPSCGYTILISATRERERSRNEQRMERITISLEYLDLP